MKKLTKAQMTLLAAAASGGRTAPPAECAYFASTSRQPAGIGKFFLHPELHYFRRVLLLPDLHMPKQKIRHLQERARPL